MHIRSIGTALPSHSISRHDTRALVERLVGPADRSRYLAAVDGSGIETRYCVISPDALVARQLIEDRAREYGPRALALASAAARSALRSAEVPSAAIDTVICVSCTGYLMPSLDAYLVERLALRSSVRRIPITELGCGGGVAALGVAHAMGGTGADAVLTVVVETCSLCLQVVEPSSADILGSILFGDGAAAAVLTHDGGPGALQILGARSVLWPNSLEHLAMRVTATGFRFSLSPALPALVRRHVGATVEQFLRDHDLAPRDIGFWAIHPGGPRVLEAVASALSLPADALRPSLELWRRCGNMAAATALFVLSTALGESAAPPPGPGVVIAFGPGVSCELVLLNVPERSSPARQS